MSKYFPVSGFALGKRIAQAREERGWTQSDLAQRIGVKHPQSVSNYERGFTEVTPRRLRQISAATGHPMAWFLETSEVDQAPDVREASLEAELQVHLEAVAASLGKTALELAALVERLEQLLPKPPPGARRRRQAS